MPDRVAGWIERHPWAFGLWSLRLLAFRWFRGYLWEKPACGTPRWTAIWCRLRQHPAGPVFYNPGGLEPDWSCKNCGDNLG